MNEEISNKYKSSNPYRVPEDYFAQKQQELLAIAEEGNSAKPVKLKQLFWSLSGVAAAFLIGFAIWTYTQTAPAETPGFSFSEVEISEYVMEDHQFFLNEDLLYEELTAIELEEEFGTSLSDGIIEEYLDENYDQTLHYEYL